MTKKLICQECNVDNGQVMVDNGSDDRVVYLECNCSKAVNPSKIPNYWELREE